MEESRLAKREEELKKLEEIEDYKTAELAKLKEHVTGRED